MMKFPVIAFGAVLAVLPLRPVAAAGADAVIGPAVSAAFGPDGRLWRVTPHEWNLAVDVSMDLGRTFSPPVLIEPGRQRMRMDAEGRPQIAVDRQGNVYVAYTADARKANQSFATFSTDGGKTFAPPASPGAPAPVAPQLRPFLLAGNDNAELYFLGPGKHGEAGDMPNDGTLYAAAVRGGGNRELATRLVTGSACECCRLDVDAGPDGAPLVLSRMVFDGEVRDFGVVRPGTVDRPASVQRVSDDDWHINACPEQGGALSIGADGREHIAWFTQGSRRQGIFYAWSDDGGKTVSAPLAIGDGAALAGHPDVLAAGGQVYLAWQQFDGRQTSILMMSSDDNGRSWSSPRQLGATEGAADYPFLRTDGKGVYVSWYATGPGYQLIPVATAPAKSAGDVVRAFGPGALRQVLAARQGTPFLLTLWSVDCAPCLREFRMLGELRRSGRKVPLVLVSTDAVDQQAAVTGVLDQFGLADVENWIFADGNAAQLRYEVDSRWFGEMPRSYFYDSAGGRTAVSGGLKIEQVTAWLDSLPPGR